MNKKTNSLRYGIGLALSAGLFQPMAEAACGPQDAVVDPAQGVTISWDANPNACCYRWSGGGPGINIPTNSGASAPQTMLLTGLAYGSSYTFAVESSPDGISWGGWCNISFTTIQANAPNNEPCNATSIDPGNSCAPLVGSLEGATGPTFGGNPGGAAPDVWYMFVAEGPYTNIKLRSLGEALQFDVYGAFCDQVYNSSSQWGGNAEVNAVAFVSTNEFIAGQTYFIRVFKSLFGSFSSGADFELCVYNGIGPMAATLRPRVYLEGPYNTGTLQMNTTLRANGLVPLAEPYSAAGYVHVGGGGETTTPAVLAITGANAIVDWVVVELRVTDYWTGASTVVATRCALLQADGDVVAASNGTSPVTLHTAGSYHVAIRHRNHLGIMTAAPLTLTDDGTLLDMSTGSLGLYGGTAATKLIGTRNVMVAGDVDSNGTIKYAGSTNDRDRILVTIGGTTPNAVLTGYRREDVNMDGMTKYTGAGNDRDPILVNIGATTPNNIRQAQLP